MKNLIRITASVATLAFLVTGAGAASAVPEPGPRVALTSAHATSHQPSCSLKRIDSQLVRCDDLTGAGVHAPSFVPVLGS